MSLPPLSSASPRHTARHRVRVKLPRLERVKFGVSRVYMSYQSFHISGGRRDRWRRISSCRACPSRGTGGTGTLGAFRCQPAGRFTSDHDTIILVSH
jgi:hypothetical protein